MPYMWSIKKCAVYVADILVTNTFLCDEKGRFLSENTKCECFISQMSYWPNNVVHNTVQLYLVTLEQLVTLQYLVVLVGLLVGKDGLYLELVLRSVLLEHV